MIRYYKNKKGNFYYKISPLEKGEEKSLLFWNEDGIDYKAESISTEKGYESYDRSPLNDYLSSPTKKISKKEWDKALEILKEFINQLK